MRWVRVTKEEALKLSNQHGGEDDTLMKAVEPLEDELPFPSIPGAFHAQAFEAPDGWRMLIVHGDEGPVYFVRRKGFSNALVGYGLGASAGAVAGYLTLHVLTKALKCPWAALLGAGAGLIVTAARRAR